MMLHIHALGTPSTDDLQWAVAQAHLWHERTPVSQRPRDAHRAAVLGYTLDDRPSTIHATPGGTLVVRVGRRGQLMGDLIPDDHTGARSDALGATP